MSSHGVSVDTQPQKKTKSKSNPNPGSPTSLSQTAGVVASTVPSLSSGQLSTTSSTPPVPSSPTAEKKKVLSDEEELQDKISKLLLADGPQLSDFERLETIGTGTFGRVYLVQHKKSGKYFAMKVMRKVDIVRLKQVDHITNEKEILLSVRHPFIVTLYATLQDALNLYMILEYVVGGEVFSHLRKAGRFTNEMTRFFAAEIVLALEYLHAKHIIYRDLKPENLLLDTKGHIKITDFGFAKRVVDRTWTLCGTPEYLAPEIIQSKGHGKAVDWWALGILIFEMLAGYPPFFDDNPFGIYEKILAGKLQFPAHFDSAAKDLIRRLLTPDRSRRLGNLKGGAEDVKKHKWFKGVDWKVLYARQVRVPITPEVEHEGDTSNFENYDNEESDEDDQQDLLENNEAVDQFKSIFKNF